jgi:hypothetical protein
MNWLLNILFPRKTGTIRIHRDHLPGLTPPKAAPFVPRSSTQEQTPGTDIQALYEQFIKSGTVTRTKRTKKDRGVGF